MSIGTHADVSQFLGESVLTSVFWDWSQLYTDLALERFAGLLRYTLDAKRAEVDDVPLAQEWAFVRDYLALERIRLGDRLRVAEDVDPGALDCPLPAFTLQPLKMYGASGSTVAPAAIR